jgi:DNA-binding transcriptional LysR family regulator
MLLETAEGQLDAAIAPAGLRLPQGVAAEAIGALAWRCFGRRGHPAFRKWDIATWTRWPHLVVRIGDRLDSPVNAAAEAAGLERRIAVWVPNFSVVAPVLARTDLLATLPALAMADTTGPFGLDSRPVPFVLEPLPHALLWSASRTGDPETAWLRAKLRPIAKRRFASVR